MYYTYKWKPRFWSIFLIQWADSTANATAESQNTWGFVYNTLILLTHLGRHKVAGWYARIVLYKCLPWRASLFPSIPRHPLLPHIHTTDFQKHLRLRSSEGTWATTRSRRFKYNWECRPLTSLWCKVSRPMLKAIHYHSGRPQDLPVGRRRVSTMPLLNADEQSWSVVVGVSYWASLLGWGPWPRSLILLFYKQSLCKRSFCTGHGSPWWL